MKGRRKASQFAIHCSTPHRFIYISLSHKNSSLPLFPSFSVDVGDGDDHLAYGFRQFVRPMKFQLFFQLPSLNRWLCPARWWLDEGMSSYTSYVTLLCGHHKTHLPSSFAIEPLLLLFVPAHLHHHHPPHQLRRMDRSLSLCEYYELCGGLCYTTPYSTHGSGLDGNKWELHRVTAKTTNSFINHFMMCFEIFPQIDVQTKPHAVLCLFIRYP